ncbi:hypothetical protein O3W44_22285 [Pantoea sp. LMR881]|uniref:hypothetical protein n=1 Tax=Pantoea sp. LMR881 TaxID=3014336 RepID=UPI0022AFFF50|nr:hypothetical protein [Pantoea sp. LMR881]MCZ4061262.1 hypothetical protein [Pantoea sp. LMR881]
MRYTVYVQYRNGATGNSYTEGTKTKIYQRFTQILSNADLRLTAKAVVIEAPRGEVYRYDLSTDTPLPAYTDIPWPRRGRTALVEDGRTVSAFITEDEQEFVRKKGGGNFSRGIRNLVNESKIIEGAQV